MPKSGGGVTLLAFGMSVITVHGAVIIPGVGGKAFTLLPCYMPAMRNESAYTCDQDGAQQTHRCTLERLSHVTLLLEPHLRRILGGCAPQRSRRVQAVHCHHHHCHTHETLAVPNNDGGAPPATLQPIPVLVAFIGWRSTVV
jgi:hypothetical protein